MIHIAVCDDNALFVEEISKEIGSALAGKSIEYRIAKLTSGKQLLNAAPFDIVLLDVEMEGMDGMETARLLREQGDECRLVFLTAFRQYVFSAFDVEADHYLMKPVSSDKLREVLLRLIGKLQNTGEHFLTIRQGARLSRIPLSGIQFVEVLDRKVYLHTAGDVLDFYGKLNDLEQELPSQFFRCHRSFIVNFAQVCRYDHTSITLKNGEAVPVAKRKYPDFCKAFLQYLTKGGEGL